MNDCEKVKAFDDILDALSDMVAQHCTRPEGDLHSGAIGANAYALRTLARLGIVRITSPDPNSRLVTAVFTQGVPE